MKARGISFQAPMVVANLGGWKSQTRRGVRDVILSKVKVGERIVSAHCIRDLDGAPSSLAIAPDNWELCPYGLPGDLLYVREAWRVAKRHDGKAPRELEPRGMTLFYEAGGYASNDSAGEWNIEAWPPAVNRPDWIGRYRPAMFMPRWASRTTLRITQTRVQRLLEITPEDAIAEGMKPITKDGKLFKHGLADRDGLPGTDNTGWPWDEWRISPIDAYQRLWDTINGDGTWKANPWVWAISFEVIRQNVDTYLALKSVEAI